MAGYEGATARLAFVLGFAGEPRHTPATIGGGEDGAYSYRLRIVARGTGTEAGRYMVHPRNSTPTTNRHIGAAHLMLGDYGYTEDGTTADGWTVYAPPTPAEAEAAEDRRFILALSRDSVARWYDVRAFAAATGTAEDITTRAGWYAASALWDAAGSPKPPTNYGRLPFGWAVGDASAIGATYRAAWADIPPPAPTPARLLGQWAHMHLPPPGPATPAELRRYTNAARAAVGLFPLPPVSDSVRWEPAIWPADTGEAGPLTAGRAGLTAERHRADVPPMRAEITADVLAGPSGSPVPMTDTEAEAVGRMLDTLPDGADVCASLLAGVPARWDLSAWIGPASADDDTTED